MNEEMKHIILEKLAHLSKDFEVLEKNSESAWDTFDVIATSEVIDRHGEVVKIAGMESENWFQNPVILANHNYTMENIVGKGTELYEDKKWRLRLKGVFTDATEMGRIANELYKAGFLKAVSIWFIVKERNESNRDEITKWELLEVSFVAVPANPSALATWGDTLQKALKLGLMVEEKEQVSQVVDITKIKEELKKELKQEILEELRKDMSDDKDTVQKEKQEEVLQNFFKNLAKNVSNSLYQMKQ